LHEQQAVRAVQVPGNIRRAEHFVAFLRRFVAYLKQRMEVQQVESETPASFLGQLQGRVAIDGGALDSANAPELADVLL
jgi:Helical and beta-bridge domain